MTRVRITDIFGLLVTITYNFDTLDVNVDYEKSKSVFQDIDFNGDLTQTETQKVVRYSDYLEKRKAQYTRDENQAIPINEYRCVRQLNDMNTRI